MNLPASIVSTLAIGLVIWGALLTQKTDSPTDQQKYASLGHSEEDLEYVAWESIKAPATSTETLSKTQESTSNNSKVNTKTEQPPTSKQKAQKHSAIPEQSDVAKSPDTPIVGLEKTIALANISSLWREFLENEDLNQQLQQNQFTIVVLYRNFTADFSRAQVAIGYQIGSLQGHSIKLPTGERTQLLALGSHDESALTMAWESIDYQRDIVAVIEHHFYDNGANTARVDVIYP